MMFVTLLAKVFNHLPDKSFDHIDCCFSGLYEIPQKLRWRTKMKFIFTVYDLTPILFPQYFELSDPKKHFLYKAFTNIKKDWKVFCISKCTKKDFLNFRPDFPAENTFVSLLAASESFYKCNSENKFMQVREKYNLPESGEYILSLCTLEPRKNLVTLLLAFDEYVKRTGNEKVKLVLTGNKGWQYDEIIQKANSPELQGRVILTGFVADEDLASLYSNSIMFIYVSIYEGFGLPILEAMKCGCAVISSNTSSMPEVGGDSVAYTNPADINEISNIIERLATDEIYRNELAMRALKRSGEFNWQKTAARIIEEITC